MNRRHYTLTVAVALMAGMVGGIFAGRIFAVREASAEKGWHGGKIVEAEQVLAKAFYLCDEARAVKGSLTVRGNGRPTLILWRDGHKLGAELVLNEDGSPSLVLYDGAERLRAALGHVQLKEKRTGDILQRTASSLVFFDENGKAIWSAP